MGKHVYQAENAVNKYDRSHGFVDIQGREFPKVSEFRATIINFICSLFKNADPTSVTVLDVGVGHGKWLFIPLILRLLRSNKLRYAIGIDNSDKMLSLLNENLLTDNISPVTLEMAHIHNISANAETRSPYVYAMHYDIEELVYNCALAEFKADKMPKFDILLLMGVLHHTINWRQALHVIVNSFLRPNSYIILSERDCESDYLDGNFYNQLNNAERLVGECTNAGKSEWYNIWNLYYELREKCAVPWKPEVSVSDISPVLRSLYDFGFTMVCEPFYERWKVNHSFKEIDNWLKDPVFSNFYRSLNEDDFATLRYKFMEHEIIEKRTWENISVNEGWKFYILRKDS